MRLIQQSDHVKSCDIKLRFDIDATRGSARRELALQIEVDLAWYHMIAVRINLMNISAVTIFLARVVSLTRDFRPKYFFRICPQKVFRKK